MKLYEYTDSSGLVRLSLLCDEDTDPAVGIPVETVDLDNIPGLSDEMKKMLHNLLMHKKLITWKDIEVAQNGIRSSVAAVAGAFNIPSYIQKDVVRALQIKFKDRR